MPLDEDFCESCHELMDGNDVMYVEAFEQTGRLLCDACAEAALENIGLEQA